MNRNRFKKKTSLNMGKLDISVKSTNANEENMPESPEPEVSKSAEPTSSSFRQPHPSPKVNKSSNKRAPAREINGAFDNVTRRKARRFNTNSDDMGKPLFERILGRCGFTFEPDGDTPHTLDQEQIFFVKGMQEQLENDTFNSDVEDFMQRFISLHENDPRLFKKSLSSTKKSEGFESSTAELNSLVHLLLEVAPLQSPLMTVLFDKLIVHVVEEGTYLERLDDVGWSRLILGQMCGLSHLVDSTAFTAKLLEMLEIANPPVQQVFLQLLPTIIYDDQQQEVARCLSKLLKQGEELTPRLLDALSNLITSRDIRENIMETVTGMLKLGRPKFLPQVISFLLTEAQFADDLPQIVQAMRRDVDLTPYGATTTQQEEQASTMVKVVATLRANLNAIGEAGDVWLTAVFNAPTVTMLDVAVLVLLYDQGDGARRKNILSLVRSKSSSGALKEQILEHTFTHHGKTLGQNFQSLTEIASHLLQCSDRIASHHGALWYKFMYLHIDGYQRQQVLYNIIMHVGLCGTLTTQSALWVLLELVKKHLALVLPQAALLMSPDGLLERVENVALEHARQIMDILCCLAYSGHSSAENLRSDISMLIKKQLACPRPQTKRKGIVGAVMATKHITIVENEDGNSMDSILDSRKSARASDALSETSESSLSLPVGHKAHQAQILIELVRASTKNNPEAYGFFYDELASMTQGQSSLDYKFMVWLTDVMVNLFQDDYVVDEDFNQQLPKEVPLSHQYGLDGDQNPIVAALGMQVVRHEMISSGRTESTRGSSTVVSPYVVCSLFRLVRILKFYTERGNLEDIDALLGCPLQLPRALQGLTRGGLMSITDPVEQRCLLNSLFLSVNWLREVVNAFALLTDSEMSDKVMQRVRHIVLLEGKLKELLPAFPPDYTPPACQFYADVLPMSKHAQGGKAGKASKKKKRDKKKAIESSIHPALDNSDHELGDVDEQSEKSEDEAEREGSLTSLSAYLRELDMTVFIMLSRDFVTKPTAPEGEEVTPELGPAELVFLLEDYCAKLEHYLVAGTPSSSSRRGRPVGLAAGSDGEKLGHSIQANAPLHFHLGMTKTVLVVQNAARVVKHLCNKLEQVINFFQELEERNDGVRDGPGSDSELARQLGRCFLLLLRCLHASLAWSGLYTSQYTPLLLEMLRELAGRVEGEASKDHLQPKLVSAACRYLSRFGDFVLQLPTAVALVSLIQVVSSHDADAKSKEAPKNKEEIRRLCKMFLSRDWPPVPGGAMKMGPFIGQLVQMYIDNSEVPLARVLLLLHKIETASDQLKGKNAPGFIEDLPNITRLTLPSVYLVLATGVATGARMASTDPDNMTQTQGGNKVGRKVQAWSLVVEALESLMTIAKTHETRPLLNALFKNSQPVVRLFMEHGMRCLDKSLRRHPAEVQALLKRLQGVTRFLQSVCCQAKMSGSSSLVQSIPNMKYLLERLVQRVKGMLVVNGCTQAFWMGNLKNRNLRGEEIQTQVDEDEEAEEDSEDERETQRRKKKKKTTQAATQRGGPSQRAGPSGVKPSQRAGPSGVKPSQKKRKSTETQKSKVSQKVNKSQGRVTETQESDSPPSQAY